MQRDLVERRGWISKEDYKEGLALAQLAPGPLAAQLSIVTAQGDRPAETEGAEPQEVANHPPESGGGDRGRDVGGRAHGAGRLYPAWRAGGRATSGSPSPPLLGAWRQAAVTLAVSQAIAVATMLGVHLRRQVS